MILRASDSLGVGDLTVQEYGKDKVRFMFIRDNEFGAVTSTFSITEREQLIRLYNELSKILLTNTAETV